MEMYETETVEQSGLRYKIQVRNNQGIWQQRHIWFPCEHSEPAYGGVVNYYREDDWILTVPQSAPTASHWKRIS